MVTKEKYILLMETALSAYSDEHIKHYFDQVKEEGLKEHGFPRLTVCIGVLAAHGKRDYLLPLFCEMMEFCCKTIPNVKAANDFSIREIICCIIELEKHGTVDGATLARWKGYLKDIDPDKCYNVFAKTPTETKYNWALFTAVSELLRKYVGLNVSSEFIDIQLATQLANLDENLMYRDAPVHPPMVYDMVSRVLFSILLHFGYRGKYYNEIDECLKKTGLMTLKMQSVSGEIPFGGRSNQFLHNEGLLAILYEFEANRYAKEGDLALAAKFKAGIEGAMKVTEHWFAKKPIYHIKNRFPLESRYGCEEYGYFDKYMITTASWFYAAYLMCDESIPCGEQEDYTEVFKTSDRFHKLFLRSGGYFLEFDIDADLHYDANGLGRVHRKGAPSALCLSVPCPPSGGHYITNVENAESISLCPAIMDNGVPKFAADNSVEYKVQELSTAGDSAIVSLSCVFDDGKKADSTYTINPQGVNISVSGDGDVAFALPAFLFDGETNTEIKADEKTLTVIYQGWACRYTTDGKIFNSEKKAYNRNGHYQVFYACANKELNIKIDIF